jgi:hypothetical protein
MDEDALQVCSAGVLPTVPRVDVTVTVQLPRDSWEDAESPAGSERRLIAHLTSVPLIDVREFH